MSVNASPINGNEINGGRALIAGSGAIVRIEQIVQQYFTGSGAIVSITQNVRAIGSGAIVTVQQVVV
jgi:hypothetical protein